VPALHAEAARPSLIWICRERRERDEIEKEGEGGDKV
jgi:hypothetical protein